MQPLTLIHKQVSRGALLNTCSEYVVNIFKFTCGWMCFIQGWDYSISFGYYLFILKVFCSQEVYVDNLRKQC